MSCRFYFAVLGIIEKFILTNFSSILTRLVVQCRIKIDSCTYAICLFIHHDSILQLIEAEELKLVTDLKVHSNGQETSFNFKRSSFSFRPPLII